MENITNQVSLEYLKGYSDWNTLNLAVVVSTELQLIINKTSAILRNLKPEDVQESHREWFKGVLRAV